MNKTYKIILLVLTVIALLYALFGGDVKFNEYEFSEVNVVYNKTEPDYLDTIVHVGLDILDIQGIIVIIDDMPDNAYGLGAYVTTQFFGGNQYVLNIKKNEPLQNQIKYIAHELIHIKQYYDGDLIWLGGTDVVWKEDTLRDIEKNIPYSLREWEVEAYRDRKSVV